MTVTAFRCGRLNKIHVYVDGEYAFTMTEAAWAKSGLRENDEIDAGQIAAFQTQYSHSSAKNKALALLSIRAHSRHELVQKLCHSFDADAAEAVAEELEDIGLLDDGQFARDYAAELIRVKQYGQHRIRAELMHKGLDRGLIDEVLSGLETAPAEQIAELIRRKRLSFSDEHERRRSIAALQRYGFGYDDIKAAIREYDIESDA